MGTEEFSHTTVFLDEAVMQMMTAENGIYVDGTFGRGGHAQKILSKLGRRGQLLAFDKDPQAILAAQELAIKDPRLLVVHRSFSELGQELEKQNQPYVDGILLDLGVSSPQLDDGARGFSFLKEGPLDMRMDISSGMSASEWVEQTSEAEIADVLWRYGEERFSRRIARAIVQRRLQKAITTTTDLADIVAKANPKWEKHKHPATRAFQAIRIEINKELEDLKIVLNQALESLRVGGRLVVISFHSLEDRIVKRFIRRHVQGDHDLPSKLPIPSSEINSRLKAIGKAKKVSEAELGNNVRSRSAVMRVAEKLK